VAATLSPTSAPAELAGFLEEVRSLVDRELDRRLRPSGDDPGRLAEAMHYAATGPGKRLRPAVAFAATEACGGPQHAALPVATAIEMLHAYTLVHDDLPAMDDDRERRGRPTVHIAFGEAIAILAGDGLLTAAFGALSELGARSSDAVRTLAQRAGSTELLLGQALDIASPQQTFKAIERMHAAKTGALFAAAAELGGIAAGAAPSLCAALGRYGLAIGIAFQHADDRDDQELVTHAETASARMKELCADARAEIAPLGRAAGRLDAIAAWITSRAT
jgi:geranylgeranyl pyrophosphate synthase